MRRLTTDKRHLGFIARDVFPQGCEPKELKASIRLEDKINKILGGYQEAVDALIEDTSSKQKEAAVAGTISDALLMSLNLQDSASMDSIDSQYGSQPVSLVLEQAEIDYLNKYFPAKTQDGKLLRGGSPKSRRLINECIDLLDNTEDVEVDPEGKIVPIKK